MVLVLCYMAHTRNAGRPQAFKDFIVSSNLDIMLVTETDFPQGRTVKVANYKLFKVDRPRDLHAGGDTTIYANNCLNATLAKVPTLNCIEATPIVLDFDLIPKLLIAAIYV